MNRRMGMVGMVTLSPFLLCESTAPQGCQPQPQPSHTGAEAAGIAIAAGAVIGTIALVEVHKSHHSIKGCVSTGSNGLDLRDEKDMKTYTWLESPRIPGSATVSSCMDQRKKQQRCHRRPYVHY